MKSDEELQSEFQQQYDEARRAARRSMYVIPVMLVVIVKSLEGIGKHWPDWVGYFGCVAAFFVSVPFMRSRGMPVCPKCGARQVHRGIPLNPAGLRSCVGCGFQLLSQQPLQISHKSLPRKVMRSNFLWVFVLAGLAFTVLSHRLGFDDGHKIGLAFVVVPVLLQIGFLSRKPYCRHCGQLMSYLGSHCNHCGAAKNDRAGRSP